jgi:hypothetical protein
MRHEKRHVRPTRRRGVRACWVVLRMLPSLVQNDHPCWSESAIDNDGEEVDKNTSSPDGGLRKSLGKRRLRGLFPDGLVAVGRSNGRPFRTNKQQPFVFQK